MQAREEYFLEAKKSLGQHFLRSEKALNTMVDSITSTDLVRSVCFEIGPGEGVLTEKLLQKGFTVVVIEIDKRSIELLKEKFFKEIKNKKLFIIERDCLEVDYAMQISHLFRGELKGGAPVEYTLIGNIPYYITGAIFRNTFEQTLLPKQVTFLIQKEVAQRIVAQDKKESLLSVSIKIFTPQSIKILDIVKAGSFVPPPKVDSAILSIKNISSPFKSNREMLIFFKILKAGFSHKRKFLLTNLKTDLEQDLFEKYFEKVQEILIKNYSEKVRAEDVEIEIWQEIIQFL